MFYDINYILPAPDGYSSWCKTLPFDSADEAIKQAEQLVSSGIKRVSVIQCMRGMSVEIVIWQSFIPGGWNPKPF